MVKTNGQVFNFMTKNKINLQNCKRVRMFDENVLELFCTQQSTRIFVWHTLFNENRYILLLSHILIAL